MRLVSAKDITAYLERHRYFGECILDAVRWQHFGTVFEFVFQYIWTDDGNVRPDIDAPDRKVLKFHGVQELHLVNALNAGMVLDPSALNWGLGEVAAVKLIDESAEADRYRALPTRVHHLRCFWEGERRIDILFSHLEVQD